MASQNPKRRSRKQRNPAAAPKAVPSPRREVRAEQRATSERQRRASQRVLGTVGEPPPSPFGGLPVSEIAIFAGIVAVVVWLIRGGGEVLIVGIVIMTLGVIEVTAREHFSGYRSHTTLLAALPSLAVAVAAITVSGERAGDAPLLFVAVPVFLLLFWPLRRRFQTSRQARVARPPAP